MKKSRGELIAGLRKEKGMTQAELAAQMGVTDKAVSKWERDLSCPDIDSLPKLAEILGIQVELLMAGTAPRQDGKSREVLLLVLRAIALAMGIAVAILSVIGRLDVQSGLSMLGIGLAAAALYLLQDHIS